MSNSPGMRGGEVDFLNKCWNYSLEGRMLLVPDVLIGLEVEKKKQQNNSKHSQTFLAFCSKPKPKHLQADKAIPASPPKKEKQWDAHRRAPMFHNPVGAAREVQSGLAQCGTVWSSCSHALVTAAPCHTPTQAPNPALAPIWGSERRKQQEMLQETNCKGTHHSCQPIRCAYRKPKASFQII